MSRNPINISELRDSFIEQYAVTQPTPDATAQDELQAQRQRAADEIGRVVSAGTRKEHRRAMRWSQGKTPDEIQTEIEFVQAQSSLSENQGKILSLKHRGEALKAMLPVIKRTSKNLQKAEQNAAGGRVAPADPAAVVGAQAPSPVDELPPSPVEEPELPSVAGYTRAGRPILEWTNGDRSTEQTVTVKNPRINGGQWTNIPTIFDGRRVDPEDAERIVIESMGMDPDTGRILTGYGTAEEAESASVRRNQWLGSQYGPPPEQRDAAGNLIPQAGPPVPQISPEEQALQKAKIKLEADKTTALLEKMDSEGEIPDELLEFVDIGVASSMRRYQEANNKTDNEMRVLREDEKFVTEIRQKVKQILFGNPYIGEDPETFAEFMSKGSTYKKNIPFVAGLFEAGEAARMLFLGKKAEAGEATPQDQKELAELYHKIIVLPSHPQTTPAQVADLIGGSLSFIGELVASFFATSYIGGGGVVPAFTRKIAAKGVWRASRQYASKRGRKWIAKELKRAGLKGYKAFFDRAGNALILSSVFALGPGAHRSVANTYRNMLGKKYKLTEDEAGDLMVTMVESGDDFLLAMAKGFGANFIEALSEQSGALLRGPIRAAFAKIPLIGKLAGLKGLILKKYAGDNAERFGGKLSNVLRHVQNVGYHGIIEEMGEERINEILRFLTRIDEDMHWPGKQQLWVEFLGFSLMGTVMGGAQIGLSVRDKKAYERALNAQRDLVADTLDVEREVKGLTPTGPEAELTPELQESLDIVNNALPDGSNRAASMLAAEISLALKKGEIDELQAGVLMRRVLDIKTPDLSPKDKEWWEAFEKNVAADPEQGGLGPDVAREAREGGEVGDEAMKKVEAWWDGQTLAEITTKGKHATLFEIPTNDLLANTVILKDAGVEFTNPFEVAFVDAGLMKADVKDVVRVDVDVEVGTRVTTENGVGVVENITDEGVVVRLDTGESVEFEKGEGVSKLETVEGETYTQAEADEIFRDTRERVAIKEDEKTITPEGETYTQAEADEIFFHTRERVKIREDEKPPDVAGEDVAPLTYRQLRAKARKLGISTRGTKAALLKRVNDAEEGDKPPDTAGIPADPWGMTKEEYIAAEGKRAIAEGATAADIEETGQKDVWAQVWEQETSDAPRDAVFPLHVLKSMNEDKRNQILKFNEGASKTWEEHQLDVRQRETDDPPQREPFEKERWERTWDEDRSLQFEGVKRKVPPHEYRAEKEKHKAAVAKAVREGKPVPAEVLKEYPDLAQKPTAPTYRQLQARAKELGISASGTAADLRERISIAEEKGPAAPATTAPKGIVVGARVRTPDGKTGKIARIGDVNAAVLMDPNGEETQYVPVKDLESAEGPAVAQVQAAKDAKAKDAAAAAALADKTKTPPTAAQVKAAAQAEADAKAQEREQRKATKIREDKEQHKRNLERAAQQAQATQTAKEGSGQMPDPSRMPSESMGKPRDKGITRATLDAMSEEAILKLAKKLGLRLDLGPELLKDAIFATENNTTLGYGGDVKPEVVAPVVGVRGRGISSKWAFAYRSRKKGKQGSKVVFITSGGAIRHGEVVGKDSRGFPIVMDPRDGRRYSIGRSTWIKILPREKREGEPISPSEYDQFTASINKMIRDGAGTPQNFISGMDIVKSIKATSSVIRLGRVLKRIFPHLNVSFVKVDGGYLIVAPNGRRVRIRLLSREELAEGQIAKLAAGDQAQSQAAINRYVDSWYNAMTPDIISRVRFKAANGTRMDVPATREQFRDMPYENQLLAATHMVGEGVIRGEYSSVVLEDDQHGKVIADSIIRLAEGFWNERTIRHEVFHFVFEMLSPSDQALLIREFGNEEKANDAYLSARKTRQEHPSSSVRKVFRKILAMGRAMARALGISVERTAGQVWEEIGLDLEFAQEILLRPVSKEAIRAKYQGPIIRQYAGQLGEEVKKPSVGIPPGRIARGREEDIGIGTSVERFELGRPSAGEKGDPDGALEKPTDEAVKLDEHITEEFGENLEKMSFSGFLEGKKDETVAGGLGSNAERIKRLIEKHGTEEKALISVRRAGNVLETDKDAIEDLVLLISGSMELARLKVFWRNPGQIEKYGWSASEDPGVAEKHNAATMMLGLTTDNGYRSIRSALIDGKKLKTLKEIYEYFAGSFVKRVRDAVRADSKEVSIYDQAIEVLAGAEDIPTPIEVGTKMAEEVLLHQERGRIAEEITSSFALEQLSGVIGRIGADAKINQWGLIQRTIEWMRTGPPKVSEMADYLVLLTNGWSWSLAAYNTNFKTISNDPEALAKLTEEARASFNIHWKLANSEHGHNWAMDILNKLKELGPSKNMKKARELRRETWGMVRRDLKHGEARVRNNKDLLSQRVYEDDQPGSVADATYLAWSEASAKYLREQSKRFAVLDRAEKALSRASKLKEGMPVLTGAKRKKLQKKYRDLERIIKVFEQRVEEAKKALRPKAHHARGYLSDQAYHNLLAAEIIEDSEKAGREAAVVVADNAVRAQIEQAWKLPKLYKEIGEVKAALGRVDNRLREELPNADRDRLEREQDDLMGTIEVSDQSRKALEINLLETGKKSKNIEHKLAIFNVLVHELGKDFDTIFVSLGIGEILVDEYQEALNKYEVAHKAWSDYIDDPFSPKYEDENIPKPKKPEYPDPWDLHQLTAEDKKERLIAWGYPRGDLDKATTVKAQAYAEAEEALAQAKDAAAKKAKKATKAKTKAGAKAKEKAKEKAKAQAQADEETEAQAKADADAAFAAKIEDPWHKEGLSRKREGKTQPSYTMLSSSVRSRNRLTYHSGEFVLKFVRDELSKEMGGTVWGLRNAIKKAEDSKARVARKVVMPVSTGAPPVTGAKRKELQKRYRLLEIKIKKLEEQEQKARIPVFYSLEEVANSQTFATVGADASTKSDLYLARASAKRLGVNVEQLSRMIDDLWSTNDVILAIWRDIRFDPRYVIIKQQLDDIDKGLESTGESRQAIRNRLGVLKSAHKEELDQIYKRVARRHLKLVQGKITLKSKREALLVAGIPKVTVLTMIDEQVKDSWEEIHGGRQEMVPNTRAIKEKDIEAENLLKNYAAINGISARYVEGAFLLDNEEEESGWVPSSEAPKGEEETVELLEDAGYLPEWAEGIWENSEKGSQKDIELITAARSGYVLQWPEGPQAPSQSLADELQEEWEAIDDWFNESAGMSDEELSEEISKLAKEYDIDLTKVPLNPMASQAEKNDVLRKKIVEGRKIIVRGKARRLQRQAKRYESGFHELDQQFSRIHPKEADRLRSFLVKTYKSKDKDSADKIIRNELAIIGRTHGPNAARVVIDGPFDPGAEPVDPGAEPGEGLGITAKHLGLGKATFTKKDKAEAASIREGIRGIMFSEEISKPEVAMEPITLPTAVLAEGPPSKTLPGKTLVRTAEGGPPEYLYRVMGRAQYAMGVRTGYLRPATDAGDKRIHAGGRPDIGYLYEPRAPGVMVAIKFSDEDGWSAKWAGGDEMYAATPPYGKIPMSKVEIVVEGNNRQEMDEKWEKMGRVPKVAAVEISKRPQQKPPKPKVAMGDWTEHYGRMPSQDDTFEEAMAGLRLNKEQKELWKELLPILHAGTRGMPSFKVGPLEKSIKLPRGPGGRYVPNTHRIELNSNTLQPSNMARLLLHEAVHAATWDIVYLEAAESWGDSSVANIRSKRGLMASSVKMKRAHQRLLDILGYMTGIEETGIEKATIEYDWVDPGGQKRHYGQSDVGEMIAEAFTNPDFQRFLSTVKVPESSRYADLRGKTLLEAFIDIVKELLGISSKEAVTALEEVLGLSHTIMEEDMWRRLASERHGSLLPEVAMEPSAPAAVEISKPEVGVEPTTRAGARDLAHLDAVERGHTEEARGLVKEAALKSGYVGPWYHHGTFSIEEGDFVFDVKPFGVHFGTRDAAEARPIGKMIDDFIKDLKIFKDEKDGLWYWSSSGEESEDGFMTEDQARTDANMTVDWRAENEDEFSSTLTEVYLRLGNTFRMSDMIGWDPVAIVRDLGNRGVVVEGEPTHHNIIQTLKGPPYGYDSVIYTNRYEDIGKDSVIVFHPKRIKSALPDIRDKDGAVIPVSQRFDPTKEDIRFEVGAPTAARPVSAEEDARYMERAMEGDEKAAGEMVDEMAPRAGYVRRLFHGATKTWTVMDARREPTTVGSEILKDWDEPKGLGWLPLFTSTSRTVAGTYGKVMELYAKPGERTVELDAEGGFFNKFQNPGKEGSILGNKFREGADVVVIKNVIDAMEGLKEVSTVVAIKDPSSVKSADPITRYKKGDSEVEAGRAKVGDIIPLSKRFDPTVEDIRFEVGMPVPAWVNEEAKGSFWKDLAKKVAKDVEGKHVGRANIAERLIEILNTEVRIGRVSIPRDQLAWFEDEFYQIRSRSGSVPEIYQRLGEAMAAMIQDKEARAAKEGQVVDPWWQPMELDLVALAKKDPRAPSGEATAEHGVGRFFQLYIESSKELPPDFVETMEELIGSRAPNYLQAMRDAARVDAIHRKRSEIAQNRSMSVVPGSSRSILKRFDEYLGKIMTDLFSGSEAFNRIHRSTFKALARVSLGLARNVTKTLAGTSADYRLAYDTYLRVPQEISRIMEGSREVQEEHEEYKEKMKKWGVKMNRWEEKVSAAKAKGVDPPSKPTKPVQPEAKEGIRVFARGLLVDNPVNYTRTEMRKFLSEGEIKELEDAGLIIPVKAASGEYVYFSPKSFREIMDGVGDKAKWEEFEFYAQGKAEHARYKAVEEDNAAKIKRNKEKLEKWEKNKIGSKPVEEKIIPRAWPGQEVFENYEKLLETVNKLEEDNPHFKESFKELEHFLNQLLLIQVYSGERTAGDVVRMVNKYTDYMPLTRKFRGSLEFTGPGMYPTTPSRAAMGAESAKLSAKDEGSTLPFLSLEAAVRERVAGTITAYYENSVMLSVRDYSVKLASGTFEDEDTGEIVDIPLDVRTLGHQLMTEVAPEIRIQGRVSPEQMRDELVKAINRNLKKFGLEKPIEAGHLEIEGPGITLVKATKPNAIRIVAPFDWAADHTPVLRPKLDAEGEPAIDEEGRPELESVTDEEGEPVTDEVEMYDRRRPMSGRRFYQISDPILYDAFKFSKSPGKFIAGYENWLGPITKAWKRRLTQNFVFGVWNLKRDPFTILALSEELGISIKKKKGETGDQYQKRLANEAAPLLIGSAHGAALLNNLFGWYPDAAEVGELLSMTMDSNMRHRRRKGVQGFWDGFKEMMKEDIWSPGYFSLPMADRFSKAPGIIHGAITKPLDIFLYITFQRAWAVRTEKLGRQGSYVLAKARGATTEQAQAASDRAPGHFANRPLSGNAYALYRTAGFANPAIQILYQHYAKWRDPDWRNVGHYAAGRMGMISVYAVIAAVVNWALTPDDEKEKMRLRPDDERMRYMSVFGKLRVPFDYGIPGIIESFTYNLTESHLMKSGIDPWEYVNKLITGLLDVPGHPTAMIHPWLKTLVLEVPGDFSFFYGKDYIPPHLKQQWPENPERQYYDSTPELYVEIGRLTGQSPLRIQHIIRGLFTSQAEELIKGYENLANGKYASKMDELEGPDRIVLGRLLQREPRGWRAQPTRDIGTVRRQLDAAKRILAIMMDGSENPEELQEQIDKVQELTKNSRWYGMLATNWEQIRKLRKIAPSSENEERIRMLERSMAVIANEQTMVDAEQLKKDGHLTTSVDNLAKFGITVFAPRFTKGPTTYFVQDVDLWDQTLSVVDRKLGAWAHRRLRLAPGQRPNADQRAAARKMAIKYKNHAWGRHLKTRRQLDKYLETGQIAAIRTP